METVWFWLVALMIAVYFILDGFDLGAGIVHLLVARSDRERRTVLRTIGPVWDGNEVWLLASGGTLYLAFPRLYAAAMSGLYLPIMIVLWLLILRGVAIEFRSHVAAPAWRSAWDAIFAGASALLAVFFGAALGNVVRGVPLEVSGYFSQPMWTNFRVGPRTGVLDWFTVLVGLAALATLGMHGALWVAHKTVDVVQARARRAAGLCWWGVVLFAVLVTVFSFRLQPQLASNLSTYPAGFIFPALALAGLVGTRWFLARRKDLAAFLASGAYIVGMLTSAVFGLYPLVLPARTDPALALTIRNASAPAYGLRVGLAWWVVGMALVTWYFFFVYRHSRGKVRVESEEGGY